VVLSHKPRSEKQTTRPILGTTRRPGSWGKCISFQLILEKGKRNPQGQCGQWRPLRGNEKLRLRLCFCFKKLKKRWELARVRDDM
jgi:hypothetical protein